METSFLLDDSLSMFVCQIIKDLLANPGRSGGRRGAAAPGAQQPQLRRPPAGAAPGAAVHPRRGILLCPQPCCCQTTLMHLIIYSFAFFAAARGQAPMFSLEFLGVQGLLPIVMPAGRQNLGIIRHEVHS